MVREVTCPLSKSSSCRSKSSDWTDSGSPIIQCGIRIVCSPGRCCGVTKRIRLGSLVACVPYRNPLVLARMTADIDALSNGRLVVGLGMGDNEDEFKQMGIALRGLRERQEMLDEAVGTLRWLWGDAPSAPASRHFSVSAEPLNPGPVQRPRIHWPPVEQSPQQPTPDPTSLKRGVSNVR